MIPARVVILSHDLSGNAVGRAYVLWQLLRHLGVPTLIIGTASRRGFWQPLAQTDFSREIVACRSSDEVGRTLLTEVGAGDLLLPVKTWPGSLGVALRVSHYKELPVLVDIDDPDHAALVGHWARLPYRHAFRLRLRLRGESPRRFDELDRAAHSIPKLISNPALDEMYGGGDLIPHARDVPVACPPLPLSSKQIRVAFVGTPRAHKGLSLVRDAVAQQAHRGFTLTITADPPRQPYPWETWTGVTSIEDGQRIVHRSDIAVVPQQLQGYGHAQLPAKLIDAMAAGRAIVAGRTPPIEWALGDTGLLVEAGATSSKLFVAALDRLADPSERLRLGSAAHSRARELFSIEEVARTLRSSITRAAEGHPPTDLQVLCG